MESTPQVNIVVWAEMRSRAMAIAEPLCGFQDNGNNDTWSGNVDGANVTVYIRLDGAFYNVPVQGLTDILIVDLSSQDSPSAEVARNYVDTRRGIPHRFVTSSEDLSEFAKGLGCEFLSASSVASEETRAKLVRTAVALQNTLRETFNSLDLNKNGVITADELVEASTKLGHQLNHEEAKIVVSSLSKEGSINFNQFRTWWVMGRGDLNTFRRLVQVEMRVGGLVKQTSEVFNQYLERLKSETHTDEVSYTGRVNIGPVSDFETGFGVHFDFAGGKDYENIVNNLPGYFRSSPMTFAVELRVQNEAAAAELSQTLQGLKAMLEAVPQVSMAMAVGVNVNFRNVGTSVFVDVSFGGMIADQVVAQTSQFDFSQLNFSGTGNFSAHTGLRVSDLLSGTVENLANRLCLFRVEAHSELSNTRVLANALATLWTGMAHTLPRKARPFIAVVRLLGVIRSMGYEFKYDSDELTSILVDVVGEQGRQVTQTEDNTQTLAALNGMLQMYQGMGLGMLEGFKPMMAEFLTPFRSALLAVDFDRISIVASLSFLRLHAKFSLHLPGLTEFARNNVLNE